MSGAEQLDAAAATARLGVSRATLYAYVSRGLVRAEADAGDPRRSLYRAADIEALAARKRRGRKPERVAEAALDWGLPVLSSGITLIAEDRLSYRGRDAAELARRASLEETARILWATGDSDPFAGPAPEVDPAWPALAAVLGRAPLILRATALLPLLAGAGTITWQRPPPMLWPVAAGLLRTMAAAAVTAPGPPTAEPVHLALARSWQLDRSGAELVRAALVLLADHELNASAFAVRVVASTGASLAAALGAGLAALGGPLHGGTTSLVEILFDEAAETGDAAAVVEDRLRRGDALPGFGHPLYPEGDPRARALLPLLPEDGVRTGLAAAMQPLGRAPNADFALVALRRALGLPRGAALALFAIGRSAGWIAHALEQAAEGKLIRPRARYRGQEGE